LHRKKDPTMAKAKSKDEDGEESTDFGFHPESQQELELEDTCCVTGEAITSSFCRFPDYRSGTMMVMAKTVALEQLRKGISLETFKGVLVKRHGKAILQDYVS
jgi:hypothetical protein